MRQHLVSSSHRASPARPTRGARFDFDRPHAYPVRTGAMHHAWFEMHLADDPALVVVAGTMRLDGPTPITSGRCATSAYRFHNGDLRPDRPTLPPPRQLDRAHLTGPRPRVPAVPPASRGHNNSLFDRPLASSTWASTSCSLPALAGLDACDDDPMRYSTNASLSWVAHSTGRSSIRSARHTTGARLLKSLYAQCGQLIDHGLRCCHRPFGRHS